MNLDKKLVSTYLGRERLYDATKPMADGEVKMTAAEDVLAWLLIEKLGCPDDRSYSPNEAHEILNKRLDRSMEGTTPADLPPDWVDGFTACALLMSNQYDRYAELRDRYLQSKAVQS